MAGGRGPGPDVRQGGCLARRAGAACQGGGTAESDIDVLVLVETPSDKDAAQEHFHGVATRVYAAFKRPLSALVMTAEEFADRFGAQDPLSKEIAYSGRVVHGKLLTEQKTLIEYTDDCIRADGALELQKQVERYFGWVQALLP